MEPTAFVQATVSLRVTNSQRRADALDWLRARAHGKWLSLHCLASTPILSVLNETLVRVKAQQRLAVDLARGTAQTEVATAEALQALPFWVQGDADLNTQAALEARARLRKMPAINHELHKWWETAQRSMQSAGDSTRDELSRDEYIRLSRLLSKAMIPDFDSKEAQQAAVEDWASDASSEGHMPRGRFMDAIFEVSGPDLSQALRPCPLAIAHRDCHA